MRSARFLTATLACLAAFVLPPAAQADGLTPVAPAPGANVPIGQPFTFQFTGPEELGDITGMLTDASDGFIGYDPIEFTETAPGTYTSPTMRLNRYQTYEWSVEATLFGPVSFADPQPRFTVGDAPQLPYTGPVYANATVQAGNAAPSVRPATLHVAWGSFIKPVRFPAGDWGKPTVTGGFGAALVAGNSSTKLRLVRLTRLTLCPGRGRIYLGLETVDDETGTLSKQSFNCAGTIAPKWAAQVNSIHPGAVPAGTTYRGDTLEYSLQDQRQTLVRKQRYKVCVTWKRGSTSCSSGIARGGNYDHKRFRVPASAGSRITFVWSVGTKRVASRSVRIYE